MEPKKLCYVPQIAPILSLLMILASALLPAALSQDPFPFGEDGENVEKPETIDLVLTETVKLSEGTEGDSRNPVIKMDAVGSIIAIWEHGSGGNQGSAASEKRSNGFLMASSTHSGVDFDNPKSLDLPDNGDNKKNLQLAISNKTNRYYIVWEQEKDDGNNTVFFARSMDRGGSFTDVKELTGKFPWCHIPRIGIGPGGIIYCTVLAFNDVTNNTQLYFVTSDDDGASFSDPVQISDSPDGNCNSSSLFVDELYAYSTWEANDRVYFSRCDHGKGFFDEPRTIDKLDQLIYPNKGHVVVRKPQIFGEGKGILYVLWNDNREGIDKQWVFWRTSSDSGDYFPSGVYPPATKDTQREQDNAYLGISPDGKRYITYRNRNDVHLIRNKRGEVGFTQEVPVSSGMSEIGNPKIIAYEGGCYVLYDGRSAQDGKWDVYLAEINEQEWTSERDKDEDGLPDLWELEYELNIFIDDSSVDNDEDTYTNLEEYEAGTDPTDPHDHPGKGRAGTNRTYLIAGIVISLLIITVLFLFWKRNNKEETKKKTISGNGQKARAPQSAKRTRKKNEQSEDKEIKRDELKKELKEKRTALELLTEEYENESISGSEFHELKEEYDKRIREIERIIGR